MRTLCSLLAVIVAAVVLGVVAPPASAGSTTRTRPGQEEPVEGSPDQEEPVQGIGIRLMEAPVSAGDDPRARVYIIDHLAPGTVIERQIEVSNKTANPQHVVMYAAAATIDEGSFTIAAGDTPNELSTWTSVSPSDADLPANGTVVVTVTIAVPVDAAPGETYGVVWAESRSETPTGGGIAQVTRVGIRLYLSVGPGGAPAPDFTISSLTASRSSDGTPVISASVKNTGGRALDMSGTLHLSGGPGGLGAGPFPADLGTTLAIGKSEPVSVTLDDRLPAGPWDASITLKSGLTERTVEATLTFPDAGAASPVNAQGVDTRDPGSGRPALLLPLLGTAALVIATGLVLVRQRRPRPRRRVSRSAVEPAVSPDGDVEQLRGRSQRRVGSTVSPKGRHARTGRS